DCETQHTDMESSNSRIHGSRGEDKCDHTPEHEKVAHQILQDAFAKEWVESKPGFQTQTSTRIHPSQSLYWPRDVNRLYKL
ncbi:hypothetical protein Tsubulata_036788, partial [Turnera subulata]